MRRKSRSSRCSSATVERIVLALLIAATTCYVVKVVVNAPRSTQLEGSVTATGVSGCLKVGSSEAAGAPAAKPLEPAP